MHLIRHCSICGNKCGRLSDSVPSCHVSSPLPARLPPAFLSSLLSSPFNAAVQFLWVPPNSLAPLSLSPALSTWASFLKHSSPYLLSPPHHTPNPSVLSTNLNLIKLFPFHLCQIASPPACSSTPASVLIVLLFFFLLLAVSHLRRSRLSSAVMLLVFEDLSSIQQRVRPNLLLIKSVATL